jgi:hypothetical protein
MTKIANAVLAPVLRFDRALFPEVVPALDPDAFDLLPDLEPVDVL